MNKKQEKGYALITVWEKKGTEAIASALSEAGYSILSTGGTARYLSENGIDVTPVESVTGFPEILDGRVKTLHPAIHGGLLADRNNEGHLKELAEKGIRTIDFLVCNLYPFSKVLENELNKKAGISLQDSEAVSNLIENIDIGGVALLRAASKNYSSVVTITDPNDYERIADKIRTGETITNQERLELAIKAFKVTASYDTTIASTLSSISANSGIDKLDMQHVNISLENIFIPRYGENPHQRAFVYNRIASIDSISDFKNKNGILELQQIQGKQLSYNNILDSQVAVELASSFKESAAVLLKHQIPCGVAIGGSNLENYERALASDPVSPFGGIFAFNREIDAEIAKEISEVFFEVLIGPSISEEAKDILKVKKNLRILIGNMQISSQWNIKNAGPLILIQENDNLEDTIKDEVVTARKPTKEELNDLHFAYNVCRTIKSNGIVLAKKGATVGIGSGQPNRVGALKIAIDYMKNMKEPPSTFVLASDAFFPFPDSVKIAAQSGCTAIIQPGGSIRDKDSIEEANKNGIAMVFTGIRHFRH